MNVISNIVNLKEWAEKYAKEWILTQNTSISSVSPLSCENIDRSVPTRERLCVCECVQTHAQVCYAVPERRNGISIEMFVLFLVLRRLLFLFVVFALNYAQELAQKPQKSTTADLRASFLALTGDATLRLCWIWRIDIPKK